MKIKHTEDYKELRAAEYPFIGEQLDALWKLLEKQAKLDPEVSKVLEKIQAVKAKYPKHGE